MNEKDAATSLSESIEAEEVNVILMVVFNIVEDFIEKVVSISEETNTKVKDTFVKEVCNSENTIEAVVSRRHF